MGREFTNRENTAPAYGRVGSSAELGALFRAERRRRGLTLADVCDATALSIRFLSEFERGKENASVGRVLRAFASLGLEVLILPRDTSKRVLRSLRAESGGRD